MKTALTSSYSALNLDQTQMLMKQTIEQDYCTVDEDILKHLTESKLKDQKIQKLTHQLKISMQQSQKYKKKSDFFESQKTYFKNKIQQLFEKNNQLQLYVLSLEDKLKFLSQTITINLPTFVQGIPLLEINRSIDNDEVSFKVIDSQIEHLQIQLNNICERLKQNKNNKSHKQNDAIIGNFQVYCANSSLAINIIDNSKDYPKNYGIKHRNEFQYKQVVEC